MTPEAEGTRLGTSPLCTGSPTGAMTIGIEVVARLAGTAAATLTATITSGAAWTAGTSH